LGLLNSCNPILKRKNESILSDISDLSEISDKAYKWISVNFPKLSNGFYIYPNGDHKSGSSLNKRFISNKDSGVTYRSKFIRFSDHRETPVAENYANRPVSLIFQNVTAKFSVQVI
jgi:hypothetical protein